MDKIGPFQLLETIHVGAQPLFRARGKDGKEVAVKAIPVANLTDEMRERFTREAETCRNLDHPNIIRVFETGEADGMLYQAMELLEGADLAKVMSESRHFDWATKLSIMEQVSAGLQYAHEHNLVHRDIKPANLFLENSGRVKVLDFGMVRVAESELTKAGASLGTLNYMSPEQIRSERVTPATDVFSAGIVFYQLASGRHPFSSRDRGLAQVVSAIVFEAPPKLSETCPGAPEGLEFILARALEKDPARRPQNAGELKQAVGLCRVTLGMAPAPAPPPAKEDLGATKVMRTPQATAKRPALVDEGKTQVLRRPPPASGQPAEDGKTLALPRMSPPKPVAPPPPPPPAPKPMAPPPQAVVPASQYSYCPSCTFANPSGSAVCQRCQTPLAAAAPAAPLAAKPSQTPLYIAIGVAALLAIVLIVVLLMK
ncbi:MAG TPA: protein kinase [Candidatus Solibacter sp.]